VGRGGALIALDRGSKAARGCDRGPTRGGARKRKRSWECSRVKARRNAWVAPGDARGPEEGGVARKQELAAGGSRGGSGRGGATWSGKSRPARVGEAAARALGRHVARFRAAWGGRCSAHGRRSGGGTLGRGKSEQSGAEQRAGGGRRGLINDFPKVQGPHCNVLATFKP
jgi:hypothetical protein